MDQTGAAREMPKYRSHKEVWALKIKTVEPLLPETGAVTLTFEDEGFAPRIVDVDNRPKPEPGWYFVVYRDAYHSFSPAKEFEEGYTLIFPSPPLNRPRHLS